MDIHEALQTAGQYIYIGFRALLEGLQKLFGMLADWFQSLPWPNAIKLFSNDTANKYLFFGIAIYGHSHCSVRINQMQRENREE